MSKKHKNIYRAFTYIENLLSLIYTVSRCISIFAFVSLIDIPIGITSSAIEWKICATAARIKKYKSIIKKKKKKHDKILLSLKSKWNSIEVLISNISHNEFVWISNVPKEFDDMKEEIKNYNDKWKFKLSMKKMLCYCLKCKCKKNTESRNPKVVKNKNGKIMPLSKSSVYNSKKSKFLKEQEPKALLSNLTGIKILVASDLSIINALFKSVNWMQ